MICTLIKAIEMNDEFTRKLVEAKTEPQFALLKFTGAMTGYHLGRISQNDMKNWEIYAEMSNTITKIFHRLDKMFPAKR